MERVQLLAHELEGLLEHVETPVGTKKPFLDDCGQKLIIKKIKGKAQYQEIKIGLTDCDFVDWNKWTTLFVNGTSLPYAPVFVARTNKTFTVADLRGMRYLKVGRFISWIVEPGVQKNIHEDYPFVRMPKTVLEYASRKHKHFESQIMRAKCDTINTQLNPLRRARSRLL